MVPSREILLSNKALFGIVCSYSITDEEYDLMEILMGDVYGTRKNAMSWLGPANDILQMITNKEQTKILSEPLEDMPLYINGPSNVYYILSRWRLKIGR